MGVEVEEGGWGFEMGVEEEEGEGGMGVGRGKEEMEEKEGNFAPDLVS